MSDPLDRLLDQAFAAAPLRSAVSGLAAALAASGLDPATVLEAAAARSAADMGPLLLAVLHAGHPVDARHVGPVLPRGDAISYMPVLVGHCSGGRVEMLLDAVESEGLSSERAALALLLAAILAEGDPPPRLLTQIRLQARRPLGPVAMVTLGNAALLVRNEDVSRVAAACVEAASLPGGRRMVGTLRRAMAGGPLDGLPEGGRLVVSDVPLRRALPRVGRNDPCPCGSGKKYKKCCEGKDRERLADPSPVAGVTMAEYRERPEIHFSPDRFDGMRCQEKARLDFTRLQRNQLIEALREFSAYRAWDAADRVLAEMARRGDFDLDGWREEVLDEAIGAGAKDVVERHLPLLQNQEMRDRHAVGVALLNPTGEVLALLEETVARALRESDDGRLINLCYQVLDRHPALGILFVRAAVTPARALDSVTLLDVAEEARDRLNLPPGDRAADLYDLQSERAAGARLERAKAVSEGRLEEMRDVRARLNEATARVQKLEAQLQAREKALSARREPPAPRPPAAAAAPAPPAVDAEELKRLRAKVADLKGLIADGQKERRRLRGDLARAEEQMAATPPVGELPEAEPGDDEGFPVQRPRFSLLIPAVERSAQKDLLGALPRLAGEALQMTAALASGDAAAWSSVKRLKMGEGTYSARVGLHHRLLFRLEPEANRLMVVGFIHRRDLEGTLKR